MSLIESTTAGHVATITLNRPDKLNAFTGTMREDLLAALRACQNEPAVAPEGADAQPAEHLGPRPRSAAGSGQNVPGAVSGTDEGARREEGLTQRRGEGR